MFEAAQVAQRSIAANNTGSMIILKYTHDQPESIIMFP